MRSPLHFLAPLAALPFLFLATGCGDRAADDEFGLEDDEIGVYDDEPFEAEPLEEEPVVGDELGIDGEPFEDDVGFEDGVFEDEPMDDELGFGRDLGRDDAAFGTDEDVRPLEP